ncbi:hypothetical protein PIB30_077971 [Stylosanthes scabra]|uniref:Uncharacterized protein n=1 Tax=Stylosanthes scabra TaxID=79078 RepID=A0ABU6TR36_9FABA|nr:hypothetical protein [Stylosanthes scabra]
MREHPTKPFENPIASHKNPLTQSLLSLSTTKSSLPLFKTPFHHPRFPHISNTPTSNSLSLHFSAHTLSHPPTFELPLSSILTHPRLLLCSPYHHPRIHLLLCTYPHSTKPNTPRISCSPLPPPTHKTEPNPTSSPLFYLLQNHSKVPFSAWGQAQLQVWCEIQYLHQQQQWHHHPPSLSSTTNASNPPSMRNLKNKKVIAECCIDLDGDECPEVKEQISLRGWRRLAAPKQETSIDLIHDFYANAILTEEEMEEAGGHTFRSYVRGKVVDFSPENLRISEIPVIRAILIHCIMRGDDVRAEDIIADKIVRMAQGIKEKGKLGFPSTIFKLCKEAGVPIREFRRTRKIRAEKPITAKRMESTRLPRPV